VASAPAMTSEWPLRYLVAECITMCAPSSIGRVSTGVAEVESTATVAPVSRAISVAAAMSVMSQVGFAGVSIQIRRGRAVRAIRAALVSSRHVDRRNDLTVRCGDPTRALGSDRGGTQFEISVWHRLSTLPRVLDFAKRPADHDK